MTSNQAREQRRAAIEGLRTSLRTISAGNSCLRSIEACEAMAMAYQCVGRLQAIDEQEAYTEACSLGKPARSPKPSIIPDVEAYNLTADQIYEAAFHKARRDEPTMPEAAIEAMAEAWDRGDTNAVQSIVNTIKLNRR